MAEPILAIDYMLLDEGGDFDPSGPSRWGVLLSEYQKHFPMATVDSIKNLTRDSAVAYYRQFYWGSWFGQIISQGVANKIFSAYVNMWDDAIRLVQRALISQFHSSIKEDGVFGPATLAALNLADPAGLLQEFRAQQARHYAIWYAAFPAKRAIDLLGLMRRAVE